MGSDNRASGRATHERNAQAVSAVPVGIPDAEWPLWAAVTTHEEFRSGSLLTITGFRWLFAPTETDAEFGVRKMMSEDYPRRQNVEVFVRAVPEEALISRRAAQGMASRSDETQGRIGPQGQQPGPQDAPTPRPEAGEGVE